MGKRLPILLVLILPVLAILAAFEIDAGGESFDEKTARIERVRADFQVRWKKAGQEERRSIRQEAREFAVDAIANDIVPAWLGTPWTMAVIRDGLKPNARRPGQKSAGISCSWFVVRVLENAGLRFANNNAFAGTIAVHFQRALAPRKKDLHRYWNVTPAQLKERFVTLGDGLYVIGLNCHIGLVHVDSGRVRFLHSSYVDPYEVVIEELETSDAIQLSQDAGYVVSPLFQDNRLIDYWITGGKVPFSKDK